MHRGHLCDRVTIFGIFGDGGGVILGELFFGWGVFMVLVGLLGWSVVVVFVISFLLFKMEGASIVGVVILLACCRYLGTKIFSGLLFGFVCSSASDSEVVLAEVSLSEM